MKILFLLMLIANVTNVLACESPPCYSLALAASVPGDVNANSILDEEDRRYFVVATNPQTDQTGLLTCLQLAIMDLDRSGKVDDTDLDLFDLSYGNPTGLPNSISAWGDANSSGMVDQQDVLHYYDQSVTIPPWGDVDGNGVIELADASVLKNCLSHQLDKLPVIQ